MRRLRWFSALVALAVGIAAPSAHADAGAEVAGGELRVTDDPGGSVYVAVRYDPAYQFCEGSGCTRRPVFQVTANANDVSAAPHPLRAGAGCQRVPGQGPSGATCEAAGVGAIVVAMGDGNDRLTVGNTNFTIGATGAPPPTALRADMGAGDDTLDSLDLANQPATVDFGPGNDGGGATGTGITTADVAGGDGDDRVGGLAGGAVTVTGGEGNDDVGGRSTGGPATVLGGAGDDRLGGEGSPARLEGGEGNDSYAAQDENGKREIIDCGPGADILNPYVRTPLSFTGGDREDEFSRDCPPSDVRVSRTGKMTINGRRSRARIQVSSDLANRLTNVRLYRLLRGRPVTTGRLPLHELHPEENIPGENYELLVFRLSADARRTFANRSRAVLYLRFDAHHRDAAVEDVQPTLANKLRFTVRRR